MTLPIYQGDCLEVMRSMADDSVDMTLTSPPYEAARTYGIDFALRGQDWVDWMVERTREMVRVSRGLVIIVCEGQTRQYRYSAAPVLLMADLHRAGFNLRKPPIFHRVGIPGSGGPDWLRNDYEFCVAVTKPGKLAWSDNTAMGHPPKWAPGGAMSNRHIDGTRKNSRDKPETVAARRNGYGFTPRVEPSESARRNGARAKAPGKMATMTANGAEPKVAEAMANGMKPGSKLHTKNSGNGMRVQCYDAPKIANPGNVIRCVVGGGVMGSKLAHENEAPFPESLAEFFIRSFCPPNGTVLDPFCGSGTTLAVAEKHGRKWIGIDARQSQVELSRRRVMEAVENA